ncbi:hypothetical protein D5041_04225 [Verminephrobacter aporrectodeae subsp. tuberculatae]|nr:hypothetical protein [Verminephrobacter aporrectodeae subsp. tuberculatae]MCW5288297.1 hypothetical protein [Verminephrobacter aporrectodeae subsp. tuberculatae]
MDDPKIVAKLRETATQLDCSVNELMQSIVRFAQTNRNWKQVGLYSLHHRRAGFPDGAEDMGALQ